MKEIEINNAYEIVSSFFMYMYNRWDLNECQKAFVHDQFLASHIFGKWEECLGNSEKFWALLDSKCRRILIERTLKFYPVK